MHSQMLETAILVSEEVLGRIPVAQEVGICGLVNYSLIVDYCSLSHGVGRLLNIFRILQDELIHTLIPLLVLDRFESQLLNDLVKYSDLLRMVPVLRAIQFLDISLDLFLRFWQE